MAGRRGQQKTHSRFQPWVLVKICSTSTSANGLANYEGYQRYLSENAVHFRAKIANLSVPGQALFPVGLRFVAVAETHSRGEIRSGQDKMP
jgi:hypothetical protein